MSDWGDCITKAVAKLDDGHSEPTNIAIGVAPTCEVLYQQYITESLREVYTQQAREVLRQREQAGEVQLITANVLAHRASLKPGAPPPSAPAPEKTSQCRTFSDPCGVVPTR